MRVEMDIDDGSSLMKLLHMFRLDIEGLREDTSGIFLVLRELADAATEHLGDAIASVKEGQPTIWY
jgi:hypothetical protein